MRYSAYVAAPYVDAPKVREVHEVLYRMGIEPTSRWAEQTDGIDDFTTLTRSALQGRARMNHHAIALSHAMLVLSRDGAGGETYVEFDKAITRGIPVYWVGRLILSSHLDGVTICGSLREAFEHLGNARDRRMRDAG